MDTEGSPLPNPQPLKPQQEDMTSYTGGGDLLVRFGVDSIPGRMVARILVVLVFFQPVYIALGMELEGQSEEVVEAQSEQNISSISGTSEVEGTTEAPKHELGEGGVADEQDTENDSEFESGSAIESDASDETNEEEVGANEDQIDTTEVEGDDSSQTQESQEADENDAPESEEILEKESDTSDFNDTQGSQDEDDNITDEVLGDETDSGEPLETTINNATNKYIFGEGDCTLVTEGEFYCIKEGPTRERMSGDIRVYSEKDREGDKEIYFFDGVEVKRITNNNYDDFAPVYDEETRRIVWNAMINDRLQIMLHELPTNTTRQITTSRENSSTPNIFGDIVVWQEWVDTNWEIMMTNVNNNGQPFEIERLTDNTVHDMFPVAYNNLITWQSERGGVWEVVVYDIRTGKKRSVEKTADTKYENPRFVLLFDSKHANGDVETIGYDLDSGEMMELGTRSMPAPIEPVTPKEEAPEAVLREALGTSQVKIETDGEGGDEGNEISES